VVQREVEAAISPQERQVQLLEELLAWTRFANRQSLVDMIQSVMSDEHHLRAFEATDGGRSQRQVGEAAGLSQRAVSDLWLKWRRLGVVTIEASGRAKHLMRPSDLGIRIPPMGAQPTTVPDA